jgi:D-amino peptidase
MKKVYIATDNEGVAGVTGVHGPLFRDNPEYLYSCEELTSELNTCISALFDSGVNEIIIDDGHCDGRNILLNRIDPRVRIIQGTPRPRRLPGLDSSFSAMILIGYHPMANTDGGVLSHTFSSVNIEWMTINGITMGEIAIDAMIAGYRGVPVIMVTSCSKGIEEAKHFFGNVETVAVKEGFSRTCAISLSREQVAETISETTINAWQRLKEFFPYKPFEGPFEKVIRFKAGKESVALEYVANRQYKILDSLTVAKKSNSFDNIAP